MAVMVPVVIVWIYICYNCQKLGALGTIDHTSICVLYIIYYKDPGAVGTIYHILLYVRLYANFRNMHILGNLPYKPIYDLPKMALFRNIQ